MRTLAAAPLALVLVTCVQQGTAGPQSPATVLALTEGVPTEAEITGGEVHRYFVELAAGDALEIRAEQRGVDLVVGMSDPTGEPFLELDGVSGQGSAEILHWVAERGGRHRLEVRPRRDEARPGRYSLVAHRRPNGGGDAGQAFTATRLFAEGQRLQSAPGTRADALPLYEEAAALWAELGNEREQARALTGLGVTLGELERLDEARLRFREALPLWRAAGDRWGEAAALNYIGYVQSLSGQESEALETYAQALKLRREIGDRQGEAQSLLNTAVIRKHFGDVAGAVADYERVLELQEEIGDQRVRADALVSLGSARRDVGDLGGAQTALLEAVELAHAIGYGEAEGRARHSLALRFVLSGDLQRALVEYRAALALYEECGVSRLESWLLRDLGLLYESLGRSDLALESLERALRVSQSLGDRVGETEARASSALVELRNGRHDVARRHVKEALRLATEVGIPAMKAWIHSVKAELEFSLGFPEAARWELEQALEERVELGNPVLTANVLERLALAELEMEELDRARHHVLAALELSEAAGNASTRVHYLGSLARVERFRGRLDEARAALEEAVTLVESLRSELSSLDLRASFLARRESIRADLIDLLMELHSREPRAGHDVAAFEASERGRSRSLLDELLADDEGGKQARGARRRVRDITREMSALGGRLVELAGRERGMQERRRIESRLEELEDEYLRAELDLSATSALVVRPLTLAEIQRDVLDGETVLLQYFLGERRSFVWRVTRDDLASFELPPRAEIESAVEELHALATAPYRTLDGESMDAREWGLTRVEERLAEVSVRLADVLLAPVAGLPAGRRLAVVADGALHQLPFGLLPDPDSDGSPLLAAREVVPIPSASVLRRLRERPSRAKLQQIAVVADPVYDRDDPRVGGLWSRALALLGAGPPVVLPTEEIVLRSARGLGFDPLRRLRFSRHEAEVIQSLAHGAQRLDALDFEASRETVLSQRFAASDVVHFATHAILHPETAGLSGIVLSLVDEAGRPRDGYLRLHDIYDLELDAELVVLSACRTGLGKEVAGEGLLGLPRAFLSAGARRVVASLWSVDDLATSELMSRFYTHLLGDGLAPAAALRAAQRALWEEGRPPAEWAGFVLLGDWS